MYYALRVTQSTQHQIGGHWEAAALSYLNFVGLEGGEFYPQAWRQRSTAAATNVTGGQVKASRWRHVSA